MKSGHSKADPLFGAGFKYQQVLRMHVGRLRAFRALNHIKIHCLSFFQGLESVSLDGTEMDKDIRTILLRDETEALLVVEPFHSSFRHDFYLLSLKLWVFSTHVLHLPWVRNARAERIRNAGNF
jgi:hypothetical protein